MSFRWGSSVLIAARSASAAIGRMQGCEVWHKEFRLLASSLLRSWFCTITDHTELTDSRNAVSLLVLLVCPLAFTLSFIAYFTFCALAFVHKNGK